jgi:hypothetical protein
MTTLRTRREFVKDTVSAVAAVTAWKPSPTSAATPPGGPLLTGNINIRITEVCGGGADKLAARDGVRGRGSHHA